MASGSGKASGKGGRSQEDERLPISNRYVFAKVMRDNLDLCKEVIELVLGTRISRVEAFEVESETTLISRRSICVDVFLESEAAAFTVEMQAYNETALPLRMRYYRSLLDRRLLGKGVDYARLKPIYIIFICTEDPFGLGLPVYTFRNTCEEATNVSFDDRAVSIALNARGELSLAHAGLAELLQYVRDGKDSGDGLPHRLQKAIKAAYDDEKWVRNMLTVEDDIRDAKRYAARVGRAEGLAEGLAEGVAGTVAILRRMSVPEAEIRRQIAKQYRLTDEQADRYMQAPAEAVGASA